MKHHLTMNPTLTIKSTLSKLHRPLSKLLVPMMLLPAMAQAHPGHSPLGSFAHQFEHQLWIAAGMVALTVGVATLIRYKNRNPVKQEDNQR